MSVVRSTNQSRRSKRNRQTRATLKPRAAESQTRSAAVDGTGAGMVVGKSQSRPGQAKSAVAVGRKTTLRSGSGITLSREREYEFIRQDLKRLVMTAGVLIVVMIALLVLVDQ